MANILDQTPEGDFADASENLRLYRNGVRSASEISSCFFGPRPWHIETRHRVKQIFTINLLGFGILKLKFRRLKLWKPTVEHYSDVVVTRDIIRLYQAGL